MGKINLEWLYSVEEAALEPDVPVIDPHQHYWSDRFALYVDYFGRALPATFEEEIARSGHRIDGTVHCTIEASYNGCMPEDLQPVAETHYLDGIADTYAGRGPGSTAFVSGIIGGTEMLHGDTVEPALEAQMAASSRFRGVRHPVSYHPSPLIEFAGKVPGLLLRPEFVSASRVLAKLGLTLDIFVFYNQLTDVVALARALPELTIVLNHMGGPLTDPRFASEADEMWRVWSEGMHAVGACENVVLKISGMGMLPLAGDLWTGRAAPPTSAEHAEWMRPFVETALECFTPARSMCASNFPTERPSANYGIVWNSLKRNTAALSADERQEVLFGTANRIYRLGL